MQEGRLVGRFWTLPNALTFVRLIFGAPATIALYAYGFNLAAWIFALFVLTDAEGILARWQGSESQWGALMDPIADQTLILPILWYLAWISVLNLTAPLLLLFRETIVGSARLLGFYVPVRRLGRIKVLLEYVAIFCILSGGGLYYFGFFALILALLFAYVSMAQYLLFAFCVRGGKC